jgi:hypothetical protein
MRRRLLLALLALYLLLVLPACGSISVDSGEAPGFSPASQVWQIETTSGANPHTFVLTNVAGYCSKKKSAEEERLVALERHEERLNDGGGQCESYDQYLDDLAAAYRSLKRANARYLRVNIDRESLVAGIYIQVGDGDAGLFVGQLQSYDGAIDQARADAYRCLNPDDVDETKYNEYLLEEEPDLFSFWDLSAGEVVLEHRGADSWTVEVDGDLLSGGTLVGSLQASLAAKRCEVPVTADTLD